LALVEFEIVVLTNGLEVTEIICAKIIIKARFRVTAGTEVFVVGANIDILTAVAAVACALLYSNRSLCKYFKSLSALPTKLQKS